MQYVMYYSWFVLVLIWFIPVGDPNGNITSCWDLTKDNACLFAGGLNNNLLYVMMKYVSQNSNKNLYCF